MNKTTKLRLPMAGIALGAVAVGALPASADTGWGSLTGQGTISPGLTEGGGIPQTFTWGGSGYVVVTSLGTDAITCTFSGNDVIGSWFQGSGSFIGKCVGATGGGVTDISGNYVRTGTAVTASGFATPENSRGFEGFIDAPCDFTPTNIDATTDRITASLLHCTFTVS